jgi:hypothetical protein
MLPLLNAEQLLLTLISQRDHDKAAISTSIQRCFLRLERPERVCYFLRALRLHLLCNSAGRYRRGLVECLRWTSTRLSSG